VTAPAVTPDSAPPGTVLAFDFGTRKIGVALGNTVTRSARALLTIRDEATVPRFAAIDALIREWQPSVLVVGRPVHADGSAHEMTARAARFARQLDGRFGLPVVEVDERYTTQLAGAALAAGGREARDDRDAVAAAIILQAWLDTPPTPDS
jgi:putative holliday junction resolvase